MARRDPIGIRLLTRNGHDWSPRYPAIVAAGRVGRPVAVAGRGSGGQPRKNGITLRASHRRSEGLLIFSLLMNRLACALAFDLIASVAFGAEWGPWQVAKDSPFVAAGFKHDDGGTLLVMCDTQTKLMSLMLNEPRAKWKAGETMKLTTRADDGTDSGASTGVVIGPTQLVVKDESTFDLYVMGKAKSFFATGARGYARIWPTANLKKSTAPVLGACGDHWPD
jgi:hypothetical protein